MINNCRLHVNSDEEKNYKGNNDNDCVSLHANWKQKDVYMEIILR